MVTDKTATVIEEEKKSAVMFVEVKLSDLSISNVINSGRYGTAERLFRVTSWVLRFVFNMQTRRKSLERRNGELSVDELNKAERLWIREAQTGLKVDEKFSQFSNSLGLIEEEGILRCRGRLQNSDLEYNAKYPILIPRDHRLTELIVQRCHREVHHGGVRATLSRLRTKFWVVRGRQMVKKLLSRCVVCKKLEGRPCSVTKVADLPKFRIREVAPFSNVGIDFAGPLFAKCCSKSSRKVYIALFTCCVTRALHLELVRDLSAETFLCCLRKFAARRGMPDLIVSDNAKTFKASERAITRLFNEPKVKAELQNKRVTWRFNLERAPWWGGFFERMVRSVKRCLRKVLGNAKLTVEELSTVLVEVEGTLNARPLTEEYEEFGKKRGNWKVAIVEELIVGRDKEVRGAKVKVTGKGKPVYLKRPIQKLYPLEVQAQPGGNGEERDTHVANSEGALHDRARRAAGVISKAKTKAMLDS